MKKVLVRAFPVRGKDSYPEGVTRVSVEADVKIGGQSYYVCEAEDNFVESGPTYKKQLPELEVKLVNVSRDSIKVKSRADSWMFSAATTPVQCEFLLCDDKGQRVMINKSLLVPFAGLFGSTPKVVELRFSQGKALTNITFEQAGVWELTEAQFNHSNQGNKYQFSRAEFNVKTS